MTTATWVTLIVIGGFVWGGFALALSTAVRRESGKESGTKSGTGPGTKG